MAPPRQRPAITSTSAAAAAIDDSRSEASSGTVTGPNPTRGVPGPKPRKSGIGAAPTTAPSSSIVGSIASSSKDLKVAAATGAAAAAMGQQTGMEYGDGVGDDLPGIPWPQMPLSILHDYRHAYKLSTPSAYARPISKVLFSSGIGPRSPTAIAARKAASASAATVTSSSSSSSSSNSSSHAPSSSYAPHHRSRGTAAGAGASATASSADKVLHKIISQDRVGKEQLALAVRKHFNAAGLVEQDAIARFLYKVREEGKGREFRLRFQP